MPKKNPGSIEKIEKFILDILFPISCQFCGREDEWLCQKCKDEIRLLSFQVCPYCEKEITEKGMVCRRCKDNFLEKSEKIPLHSLLLASEYKSISSLVHLFKYRFIEDLGGNLGEILVKSLLKNDQPLPDIIIPVPLHRRRLRWRGFNQAEILARAVSENLSPAFPIQVLTNLLRRKKYTPPQMKIKDYGDRLSNLKDAFEINPELQKEIAGKNILLIDDIVTTGTTILECAKILSRNGARKISATALARQMME